MVTQRGAPLYRIADHVCRQKFVAERTCLRHSASRDATRTLADFPMAPRHFLLHVLNGCHPATDEASDSAWSVSQRNASDQLQGETRTRRIILELRPQPPHLLPSIGRLVDRPLLLGNQDVLNCLRAQLENRFTGEKQALTKT